MTSVQNIMMDHVALGLDNGTMMNFTGRVFAESSWYDEDTAVLTQQKLYITDKYEQVYSVVSGSGKQRSRRAYKIVMQGDICHVTNGATQMSLPLDLLMLSVRSLCGLDGDAVPSLELVEETLRAANC